MTNFFHPMLPSSLVRLRRCSMHSLILCAFMICMMLMMNVLFWSSQHSSSLSFDDRSSSMDHNVKDLDGDTYTSPIDLIKVVDMIDDIVQKAPLLAAVDPYPTPKHVLSLGISDRSHDNIKDTLAQALLKREELKGRIGKGSHGSSSSSSSSSSSTRRHFNQDNEADIEVERSPLDRRVRQGNVNDYIKYLKGTPDTVRLQRYRNLHSGKRAFIIGNGPSLLQVNLTLLRHEITFGVNSIFYHFNTMGFKPTYYVVEDLLVAEDRFEDINTLLNGTERFFGTYLSSLLKHHDGVNFVDVTVDYDDKKDSWPRFSSDASKTLFVGGTVTYLCSQLAYYMGIETVYMIGFDHKYIVPDSVDVNLRNPNTLTSTEVDPNHFHPDYFGVGKRWHLPRTDRMDRGFLAVRRAFEKDGRHVINVTPGGHLEVLPRVSFNEITKDRLRLSSGPSLSVAVCIPSRIVIEHSTELVPLISSLVNQSITDNIEIIIVLQREKKIDDFDIRTMESLFLSCKCSQCRVTMSTMSSANCKNTGVLESWGRNIFFMTYNTVADHNLVARILRELDLYPKAACITGLVLNDKLDTLGDKPKIIKLSRYTEYGEITDTLEADDANLVCRRKIFTSVGWFDEILGRHGTLRFGSDVRDLALRIADTNAGDFVYQPNIVVIRNLSRTLDSQIIAPETVVNRIDDSLEHTCKVYLHCKYQEGNSQQITDVMNNIFAVDIGTRPYSSTTLTALTALYKSIRSICNTKT